MMGKRGPKLTEVNWDLCQNLLRIQCTGEEIAGAMDISYDTLERACKRDHEMKFADYSDLKRAEGRASLRRAQWKAAQSGNPTMLIWLGKQMLGQRDKQDFDLTTSDGSMRPTTVVIKAADERS
jgi:hypothetical protein